jgi:hypothetical protein
VEADSEDPKNSKRAVVPAKSGTTAADRVRAGASDSLGVGDTDSEDPDNSQHAVIPAKAGIHFALASTR